MSDAQNLDLESGWSYCNDQILEFMPLLLCKQDISVLEFGCGNSTVKIYDYLKQKIPNVSYMCYETDEEYGINHEGIELIYYKNVKKAILPRKIFDLILIDGPTGKSRVYWYKKIIPLVQNGTLLHIDDFDHYKQFERQLNKYHNFKELFRKERSKKGEKSWLTVEIF